MLQSKLILPQWYPLDEFLQEIKADLGETIFAATDAKVNSAGDAVIIAIPEHCRIRIMDALKRFPVMNKPLSSIN